jgi:hypothetical protein
MRNYGLSMAVNFFAKMVRSRFIAKPIRAQLTC